MAEQIKQTTRTTKKKSPSLNGLFQINVERTSANSKSRATDMWIFSSHHSRKRLVCVCVCERKMKTKGSRENKPKSHGMAHGVCNKERAKWKKKNFFFFLSHTRNAKWEPKWKLGEPALKSQLTDVCAFLLVCKLFLYIYRIEKIDWTFFCSLFHCPRTTLAPCLALSFFHSVDVIVFDFAVFLWNLLMLIFVRRFLTQVYCLQTTISNLTNRV